MMSTAMWLFLHRAFTGAFTSLILTKRSHPMKCHRCSDFPWNKPSNARLGDPPIIIETSPPRRHYGVTTADRKGGRVSLLLLSLHVGEIKGHLSSETGAAEPGNLNGLVYSKGKFYRKLPYSIGKTMVSCRISLKPIHWLENGPYINTFIGGLPNSKNGAFP